MPVTFWTFVVYTLAISGIPLTSGFLSKDEILAGTLAFGGLTGTRDHPDDRVPRGRPDGILHVPACHPDVSGRAPRMRTGSRTSTNRRS